MRIQSGKYGGSQWKGKRRTARAVVVCCGGGMSRARVYLRAIRELERLQKVVKRRHGTKAGTPWSVGTIRTSPPMPSGCAWR